MAQTTPKYKLPVTEPGDVADHPAYSADLTSAVETALDGKATAPPVAGAYVPWTTPGYSGTPVLVWNRTPADLPVGGGQPSNGTMIQLQWIAKNWPTDRVKSTLRAHIDAAPGQPGRQSFDLAPAHDQPLATAAGPMDSAVMSYDNQHLSMLIYNGACVVGMNGTNLGALAWVKPSSQRFKAVDTKSAPDAAAMVADVSPVVFEYKTDDTVPTAFQGQKHYGFIAEDVAAAAAAHGLPDAVVTRDAEGHPDGLSDRDLLAVLWAAVQDLQAEVQTLKGQRS